LPAPIKNAPLRCFFLLEVRIKEATLENKLRAKFILHIPVAYFNKQKKYRRT